MAKISYSMVVTVPGGPQANIAGDVTGDTYSKSDVEVPAKVGAVAGTKSVNIAAGDSDKIVLLAITTDKDSYSKDVEFKLDAAAASLQLTAPFVVVGSAAAQLISTDPNTVVFTNNTDKVVKIEILTARNAAS